MRTLLLSIGIASVVIPSGAFAQQKPGKGVITLAEVTIVGRVQKPIAAVDVNRLTPKLTVSEQRQPFIERIEKALQKEPF